MLIALRIAIFPSLPASINLPNSEEALQSAKDLTLSDDVTASSFFLILVYFAFVDFLSHLDRCSTLILIHYQSHEYPIYNNFKEFNGCLTEINVLLMYEYALLCLTLS